MIEAFASMMFPLCWNMTDRLHASSSGPKTLNLRPGTRAKAIVGPFRGTLVPGETFEAVAGMTYGWLLEADGDSL